MVNPMAGGLGLGAGLGGLGGGLVAPPLAQPGEATGDDNMISLLLRL